MSRDDLPRSLLAVLQKGMASDRNDRFATAVDFARALQRVELELGYAPTTIEVPNLLVAAPTRDAEADDENETKVRTVATIEAQPAAPPRPPAAPREPEPVAEPTMLRGAKNVVAQPQSPPPSRQGSTELPTETVVRRREPVAAPAEAEPPAPKRKSIAGWIIGAVALLVAAGVTLAIVLGGVPTLGDGEPKPTNSAAPVVIESIPTPQVGGPPAVDGSTITWTFTNPEPEDGDTFFWRISNRTSEEPNHQAEGNAVVITDYAPGSTVCINVSISRNGKLSAKPYETCYPQ